MVADAIYQGEQFELEGVIDAKPGEALLLGRTVVRGDLNNFKSRKFIVAIGDNKIRKRCFEQFVALGLQPVNVIHPSAVLSEFCKLQVGIFVGPRAIINALARIDSNTIINSGAIVEHDCEIGAHCHVAPGSVVGGGARVLEGGLVGIGSTLLPRAVMGEWSTLGAGSTLIDSIEQGMTAVGLPAMVKN